MSQQTNCGNLQGLSKALHFSDVIQTECCALNVDTFISIHKTITAGSLQGLNPTCGLMKKADAHLFTHLEV